MINIQKCIRSFSFAFKGLFYLIKIENNAKVHLLATFSAIILGWIVGLDKLEWLWISLAITLVWVAEAINTAIEKIIDLYTPKHNPIAGIIKDLSAGAVLIAAMFAILVSIIIFYPKFFN